MVDDYFLLFLCCGFRCGAFARTAPSSAMYRISGARQRHARGARIVGNALNAGSCSIPRSYSIKSPFSLITYVVHAQFVPIHSIQLCNYRGGDERKQERACKSPVLCLLNKWMQNENGGLKRSFLRKENNICHFNVLSLFIVQRESKHEKYIHTKHKTKSINAHNRPITPLSF